mmetsp:Transcript_50434/g.99276  ORF Transcript_50434/g.99276 Transcript_50434/m.99276 type:complete len:201 (+) Transcript_50434:179-781(+)
MIRSLLSSPFSVGTLVFRPFSFGTNCCVFLWCEVVEEVELFPDHLRRLSLHHVRNLHAAEVEHRADVQKIRSQDQLEQCILRDVNEVCIPVRHDLVHFSGLEGLIDLLGGVVLVVSAVADDLLENVRLHLRKGNRLVGPRVFVHILDQPGHAANSSRDLKLLPSGGGKREHLAVRHFSLDSTSGEICLTYRAWWADNRNG